MEDFLYAYNQPKKFGKYDLILDGKIIANEVVYKVLTEDNDIETINLADKLKELESRLQTHFTFETVTELPTEGKETVIYLVANDEESGDKDSYNEYMWVKEKGEFELIGSGTYAQQKADLDAEVKRATQKEKELSDAITNETKRATEKEATIDAELAKRVPYTLYEDVDVVGNVKDVVKLDVPESPNEAMYCPQGLIMGGTALAAGLVTRGICGSGIPTDTGSCSKENLYINYDGKTTYSPHRQLIIQADNIGEHYGHNLYQYAAARGDAVKGYVDAKITTETTAREALQEEVTTLKSQVNMLEIRIDFLEGQNISENIETNIIEEALVDSFTQPITLNNVVISSPQNLALNKENDVNVSIGSITIDGMTYGDVQTIAEGDSFLATDTDKIFINNLGQIGEKDDDGNITKNVIKCKVNVRGNDVDGKEVNVISGVVSITLNGDYKNVETSLYSYLSVLPDGYRRVQYLESTCTQWIDTGVKLSSESEVKCEYMAMESTPKSVSIYGIADTYGKFYLNGRFSDTQIIFYCWGQEKNRYVTKTVGTVYGNRFKVRQNYNETEVNGVINLIPEAETSGFESYNTARLFRASETNTAHARIYSFSISRNNQLQLNFIPCLDETGTPCMYDTVLRKAFYNKGTGDNDFLTDRTLPDGYTELEYLEVTGTQWINTGIKVSRESEVRCEHWQYYPSEIKDYRYLYHADKFFLMEGYVGSLTQSRLQTGARLNEQYIYPYWNAEEKVVTILNNEGLSVNGVINNWKEKVEDYESTKNLYLFCIPGQSQSAAKLSRIYSFSISRAGVLQLDFQPALDDQGKPCMYDFATNTPFYNEATTGDDFVYVLPGTGTATLGLRRQDFTSMGSLSKYGLRRIHRLPFNFDGDMEKFISENNIKPIVKTEMPNDGKYYVPQWTQDDEIITLEWIESEPPTIDEITE